MPISVTPDSRLSRVPELLDRLELRGPGRHPVVVLGGPDRDARLVGQLGDRLELVLGPRVRAVVIDVEQPEDRARRRAAARCTACRTPPGRPPRARRRRAGRRGSRPRTAAGCAWMAAAGSDRAGKLRRLLRYSLDSPRLTSAAMRAVVPLQEDGGRVALEQDHGVVDQPGQDPVEVEPAADVAGDPAQRLGPVAQVIDLGAAPGDADQRPEAGRARPRRVEVVRRRAIPPSRRRSAGRPTGRRAPGSRWPARDGRRARPAAWPTSCTLASSTPSSGPVGATAEHADAQRRPQDPEAARKVGQARFDRVGRHGDDGRAQPVDVELPDRDMAKAVGVADDAGRGLERIRAVVRLAGQPGEGGRHRQVEPVAFRRPAGRDRRRETRVVAGQGLAGR